MRIEEVKVPRRKSKLRGLVPHVLFYDVPLHVAILKQLLKDFDLGHHLLLIGNQGVGKNKVRR